MWRRCRRRSGRRPAAKRRRPGTKWGLLRGTGGDGEWWYKNEPNDEKDNRENRCEDRAVDEEMGDHETPRVSGEGVTDWPWWQRWERRGFRPGFDGIVDACGLNAEDDFDPIVGREILPLALQKDDAHACRRGVCPEKMSVRAGTTLLSSAARMQRRFLVAEDVRCRERASRNWNHRWGPGF